MVQSYPSHAVIDPANPEALGICDRCGSQWNLSDLRYQMQWNAVRIYNTGLKVCPTCYDEPSEFLRTLILPPDPAPVYDTRPAQFYVQERNAYTLKPAAIGQKMFPVVSSLFTLLSQIKGLAPFTFSDTSSLQADLELAWQMLVTEPVALLTEDGVELITEDEEDYIGTEGQGFAVTGNLAVTLTLTTP